MTREEAITIVARHAAAKAIEVAMEADVWEDYPELTEAAMEEVENVANTLVTYPSDEDYKAAVAMLASEATDDD